MILAIQLGFIICMFDAIFLVSEHDSEYDLYVNSRFSVLFAKFLASGALHMMLYPHIEKSLKWMKFVINHSEELTNPNLCFVICLMTHFTNIGAELINIYMLAFQHSVEHCIIHFVALEVIVEIPHIFMHSLIDDKLKERIFQNNHAIKIMRKGSEIDFWQDRCITNKLMRVIYKFNRLIYVSCIFYFQPFMVIFVYSYIEAGKKPAHH